MFIEWIGVLGITGFLLLLILRVPIAIAMLLIGIVGNYFLSLAMPYFPFEAYLYQFKTLLWSTFANYNLAVIPLFIFMGSLVTECGLAKSLFQGFSALTKGARGGLAVASIISCASFSAVCGSSLATASTMGKVALPQLKAQGYSARLAIGSLSAGGTLGILIPPSIVLMVYAVIVEVPILTMFQAALIPGLLAVFLFLLVVILWVIIFPKSCIKQNKSPIKFKQSLLELIPPVVILGSVLGGMMGGLFSPMPAAAFGVGMVLLYGCLVRLGYFFNFFKNSDYFKNGSITFVKLKSAIFDTAEISGLLYFIIFGAEVIKGFLVRSGLPVLLADVVVTLSSQANSAPLLILGFLLLALIILGFFVESFSLILVVVPFFWPALSAINGGENITSDLAVFALDNESLKIWFGILVLVVVELGLITPPIGLNLLAVSRVDPAYYKSSPMAFLGVMPFVVVELFRILLLLFFPAIVLFFPHFMG